MGALGPALMQKQLPKWVESNRAEQVCPYDLLLCLSTQQLSACASPDPRPPVLGQHNRQSSNLSGEFPRGQVVRCSRRKIANKADGREMDGLFKLPSRYQTKPPNNV